MDYDYVSIAAGRAKDGRARDAESHGDDVGEATADWMRLQQLFRRMRGHLEVRCIWLMEGGDVSAL